MGIRLIIPAALQKHNMFHKICTGHQGINKCRERAQCSVWWPGISKDITFYVENCIVCAKSRLPRAEPMASSKTPDFPWQKVGCYLFTVNGM